jgi:hypothetical protein
LQHDRWFERPLGDDMRPGSPRTLPCLLLESVLPDPYREAILGDLIEEYALRTESTSRFTASRWLWSQACRSILCMFWTSLRSRNCLDSFSVAVGVYLSMAALKFAGGWTITKVVSLSQTTDVILAPIVFLITAAIGGCVTAKIRPGATIFLALMVTITVAILIDVKFCSIPVPWWYQFGFLTLGPLAVIITPVLFGSSKQQGSVT